MISCEDGQMLKQVQHDESLMLGHVVLSDNDDKQLNKLINQEPKNNAKIKPSCRSYRYRRQERSSSRTRQVCSQLVFSESVKKLRACYFGIYPENGCHEVFSLFVNRKIFNKFVFSLRCLFVRCRNEFGMTPDCGGAKAFNVNGKCQSGRVRRFDAPQGLALQGFAQC